MRAQRNVAVPVHVDQLAAEVADRAGRDRVTVLATYDPDTLLPVVVAVDDVDEQTLDDCLADHVPVWPEPPPDPVDVLADGIQAAATLDELQAALAALPDVIRDLRARRR